VSEGLGLVHQKLRRLGGAWFDLTVFGRYCVHKVPERPAQMSARKSKDLPIADLSIIPLSPQCQGSGITIQPFPTYRTPTSLSLSHTQLLSCIPLSHRAFPPSFQWC
jgi:hypothetical protein